jgi:hypothetical protein
MITIPVGVFLCGGFVFIALLYFGFVVLGWVWEIVSSVLEAILGDSAGWIILGIILFLIVFSR